MSRISINLFKSFKTINLKGNFMEMGHKLSKLIIRRIKRGEDRFFLLLLLTEKIKLSESMFVKQENSKTLQGRRAQ